MKIFIYIYFPLQFSHHFVQNLKNKFRQFSCRFFFGNNFSCSPLWKIVFQSRKHSWNFIAACFIKKRKKQKQKLRREAKREITKTLDALSQRVVIIKVFREGGKCGKPPQDRDRNLGTKRVQATDAQRYAICAYILWVFGADHINQPKSAHTYLPLCGTMKSRAALFLFFFFAQSPLA